MSPANPNPQSFGSSPRAKATKVLIAGGGIGGLATALALARRGIPSQILERRPIFGEDGAGIQIGPNGTRILEQLGAAEFLRARVTVPDALRILDAADGRKLAAFPLGRWIALRHGAPYWVAHRRDLHGALMEAVSREPRIDIRYATEVSAVCEQPDQILATSTTGEDYRGSALIVADGAWSTLRTRAFEGAPPRYTGQSAARAVIPIDDVPDALHRTEVHLWLGPDAHVVHYPVSSGHAVAIVAIFKDDSIAGDWSAPCDREWVLQRTSKLAPLLRDLLARPEHWRRWSLLELPRRPRPAIGRMALLGDAAHPVLPFLAQGGVMALEDAMVVADALAAEPDDVARALAAFASARAARVRRVARASQINGRIYHLSGPVAAARNFALARLSPETFMSRYDWLYGWTPPEQRRVNL